MYYIKWLLKITFWLVLLIIVFWFGVRFYFWLQSAEPMAQRSDKETRSNVHWLHSDKALVYNFSPSRTYNLRILSNAIFAQQVEFDKPINYAIEYTLLDQDNNQLMQKVYHHASKLALDADQQQVKQIIENKAALSVSSGQSFYINSEQLTNASRIALRVIPEDSSLKGVVVRIHAKTPTDTDDINSAWLKLPVEWRERTIAYHTIGANAITTREIHNAVTFDWLKLAPQGVPDIDFKADTLYETLPYHVLTYDFGAQQLDLDGFYTVQDLSASFRVYEGGDITANIKGNIADINITWYDLKQREKPKKLTLEKLESPNTYQLLNTQPGLIVIQSKTMAQSSWFLADTTPISPLHSYYYGIDESLSANYRVAPNSDINFQFRGAQGALISVSLFNTQKQLIETHQVKLQGQQALFDRIITPDTLRSVTTDSERFYLRLPSNAAFLSISSKETISAKMQARQAHFHYQTVLCEALCQVDLPEFTEIDAWFSQQAQNDFTFTEQQKMLNVRLFEPPPEIEVKQTFHYGRNLIDILPRSNTALIKTEPKYFDPIDPPKDFNFRPLKNLSEITVPNDPILLAKSRVVELSSSAPFYTEYALNDLPDDAPLRIQSKRSHFYTNLGSNRSWAKQRLFKLKAGQSLELSFDKRPDSIVIKLYSDNEQDTPLSVDTHLHGHFSKKLTDEYTISKKRYALVKANENKAFLLHPAQTSLFSYPSITIPINNDIELLKKFTIKTDQDVWVSVLEETSEQQKQAKWWLYEAN
ncbi:hypothetical protein [Pseudoalteromonas aurantia]|uniref:Uncharacterized protein n=1 Tax=Pseudoalteromonas aurantia 208 TaxID=1314867 RepID=A0ABR9EFE5_9GAMM|nr:hypothetical protein [Pseudoalteromonas aurantia]MBE0369139.1 hypothetical protein [Pseudoalteromonas aurantia 208]